LGEKFIDTRRVEYVATWQLTDDGETMFESIEADLTVRLMIRRGIIA
jgi:hypothetical protein